MSREGPSSIWNSMKRSDQAWMNAGVFVGLVWGVVLSFILLQLANRLWPAALERMIASEYSTSQLLFLGVIALSLWGQRRLMRRAQAIERTEESV